MRTSVTGGGLRYRPDAAGTPTPQERGRGVRVEPAGLLVNEDRARRPACGIGKGGLDLRPPCLTLFRVGEHQDHRGVPCQPQVQVTLIAQVLEGVLVLEGEQPIRRLALDQENLIQQRP